MGPFTNDGGKHIAIFSVSPPIKLMLCYDGLMYIES